MGVGSLNDSFDGLWSYFVMGGRWGYDVGKHGPIGSELYARENSRGFDCRVVRRSLGISVLHGGGWRPPVRKWGQGQVWRPGRDPRVQHVALCVPPEDNGGAVGRL